MHSLIAVLLLAAATSYKPSVSLTAPVNPQLVQRRDAIAANLAPSAKQKLHTIAMSLPSPASITDGTSHAAIASAFGDLNGADVEALMFLVLMDAAQSAQQDLQAIMDHVKAINKAKQQLRDDLAKVHQMPAANGTPSVRKVQVQSTSTSFMMPPPLPPDATVAQKQDRLAALNDLDQQQQVLLQQQMDRKQRLEGMATSVMKNLRDVNSAILGTLK